jgi:ketosteroid isomerase-like protein
MSGDLFGAVPVADRIEIDALYARQSHAVDESDGEAWAATYTEDGVFESPTYRLSATGPAELAAFARDSNDRARGQGRQFRHVISSVWLTSGGPDRMHARAYLMIHVTDAESTKIDRSIVLNDTLVRTDGGWRVQHRAVQRDGLSSG